MNTVKHGICHRLVSWLLCASLVLSLLPAFRPTASAASWAEPYLNELVSWGVMRGDQDGNLNADYNITRAEYLTMINRAYGYDETARTPFTDVPLSAWYADDIGIAYRAGYFTGTSSTTASPDEFLTREQATVMLGRNLMLQEGTGESLDFTDSRDLSYWSRGYVKTAAEYGVINGLPDGSFQPQRNITRGEVASMLVSAIGTPINAPGEYSLGSVYGNVTVSSSGVTLRNTTIAGDLYLTGGVGLGYITMENVTVLGRIIASGAGEANKGESSIILRNVTAPEMVVDSLANQYVTIRAEGDTLIDKTSVRTPAYLEDASGGSNGLTYIELNGERGTTLELSGNIKEVVNFTPGSTLNMALGSAQKVTVDEAAVNSRVNIAGGSEIKTLNLDTGAGVSGNGDVGTLNVNSNGSTVSMLPDDIVIRPGVNANVNGTVMDSTIGAESSQAPKLLSGYPRTADVAPSSATALFSTNKSGTVYWAVSSITDGSVSEADLISPPAYASKLLKNGSVNAASASSEIAAKITGLTSDGSYYLSAILVDSRDQRSPVKVVAFTTPDDSVPNFASGYPVMTKITNNSAQATVMSTKNCQLYYALLPKGSAAPSAADFKANAVTGNLGFGIVDIKKNTTYPIPANDKVLEELNTYDLYLWLNDADNAKSSAVKKLTFTTVDMTPPKYNVEPTVNSVKETTMGLYVNINEVSTLYWAVVKEGAEYPKPLAGSSVKPELTSETAKLQVMAGMNALKSGKVSCAQDKDVTFAVSGLTAETAYDLYYVAQDKAGNYSASVQKITLHTLDNKAPTVEQKFTRFNSSDSTNPLSDTDIQLIFSEGIRDNQSNGVFLTLYDTSQDATKTEAERAAALNTLAGLLRNDMQLWTYGANGLPTQVQERTSESDANWIIDYRNVKVEQKDGKVIVTFPTDSNSAKSALNLRSGGTYYFVIDGIADTSDNKNIMPVTTLDEFKTVFAQVNLASTNVDKIHLSADPGDPGVEVDLSFQLIPVSTGNVEDSVSWDMLLWSDISAKFEIYYREKGSSSNTSDIWTRLGEHSVIVSSNGESPVGSSLTGDFITTGGMPVFPALNQLTGAAYEYAIRFTELDGMATRESWTQRVTIGISIAAGSGRALSTFSRSDIIPSKWLESQSGTDSLTSIGVKEDFQLITQFQDQQAPTFIQGHPIFKPGDTVCDITVMLNRPATIYYVVSQVVDGSSIIPPLSKNDGIEVDWSLVPKGATHKDGGPEYDGGPPQIGQPDQVELSSPSVLDITNPKYGSVGVVTGYADYKAGAETIHITGLVANQKYHVYFVLKGASRYSEVKYYGFETGDVTPPAITLRNSSPSVEFKTDQEAVLDYILFTDTNIPRFLKEEKLPADSGSDKDYTLLKALTEKVSSGPWDGYSYFDAYADTDQRDRLQSIIRAASTSSLATTWGTLQMRANSIQSKDFSSVMSSTATYTCLAVSHHVQGTKDTFKAVTGIRNLDNDAPDIKEAPITQVNYPSDWDPATPTRFKFSGTVSITFSEEIYILTGKIDEVTGLNEVKPVVSSYNPGDDKVAILSVLGGTIVQPDLQLLRSNAEPTRTIDLKFSNVSHGQTIIFYANGTIADANGNDSGKQLTLTFNAAYKDNTMGLVTPRFDYTWN